MEIWKSVKDYEDYYEISTYGKLLILERECKHSRGGVSIKKAMIAKPRLSGNGYILNAFNVNNNVKSFLRHRLVAEAFIPNPLNLPEVNHKDGNKLNCHVDNLEWCTLKENRQHAVKIGLIKSGEDNYQANLTNQQVREIRELKGLMFHREIGKIYGVSRKCISLILNNKTYKNA